MIKYLTKFGDFLFPTRTGDYVTTDFGYKKILNNKDPLKLGRVLTVDGWAYPIFDR